MASKKRTPAVPARGLEITLVANFPRPKAWGQRGTAAGDAKEIGVMEAKNWHPGTDDFLEVANVPNRASKGKRLTEVTIVDNMGGFLGAILGTDSQGNSKRPTNSIKRLNLISHGIAPIGGEPLYALSGRIADNGDCFLHLSVPEQGDPNRPMQSGGIDQSVIDWLNHSAKSIRDECRARFREDGEIGLIMCHSSGAPLAALSKLLLPAMGKTFNVMARGYHTEIVYESDFRVSARNADGTPSTATFVFRNHTRIADSNTAGLGYFCAVPVPKDLAGEHLKFSRDIPKPASPSP